MPPASDGTSLSTVGCALSKLLINSAHLQKIQDAVVTTHKATILASELLNMHIRRILDTNSSADLSCCFTANWVLHAYNEVTFTSRKNGKFDLDLRSTRELCMPPFSPPERGPLQQCFLYDARNLVTVAATNVWMHFSKRVLAHVQTIFALDKEAYSVLSKEKKRQRKLELMQIASDICSSPESNYESPKVRHAWIANERTRLGIDAAVENWSNKPLLYHLKTKPHRFLNCMRIMSKEQEAAGRKAFALYPIRRTNVPRHVRFDQKALRDILKLGCSDYIKEKKRKRKDSNDLQLLTLSQERTEKENTQKCPSLKLRRKKEDMKAEQHELFSGIVDLRAAKVKRPDRFDFAFTTDGVCARVQMQSASIRSNTDILPSVPKRGVWAIDQLKHTARLEDLHTIGIDPGKREIVVGVDMDHPKSSPAVRYTLRQRQRDLRTVQYSYERDKNKPSDVKDAEAKLAGFNSRASCLREFCAYCAKRHETLDVCLAFYADVEHRKRRWKTAIKTQKSEERLYKKLKNMKTDSRPLVLAYGSWGVVAGRPGLACNKGNAPCIGAGLMRKLARRFIVAPTPEAYTSKTCCRCFGECGPWEEIEVKMGKKIRGLRRCTQRDCMIPLNRDKNGATNIGTNFLRLMTDKPPIRSMTDADFALHRASLCIECV